MSGAVRSELRKLTSVRAMLAFPIGAVVYGLLAFGPVLFDRNAAAGLDGDSLLHVVRGPGFVVGVAMLLLGILVTAGEFRHGTIATTLSVTPRRTRVLSAKALAVAAVAALTALAVEVVALSLGVLVMRANDVTSTAAAGDLALGVVGVVSVAVLYGLVGVGLGMALRDQTAAVGAALVWIGIVEGMVPVVLRKPWLFKWLPSGAANSVLGLADPPPDLLPAWAGALMLTAVAAALLAAATAVLTTRDA